MYAHHWPCNSINWQPLRAEMLESVIKLQVPLSLSPDDTVLEFVWGIREAESLLPLMNCKINHVYLPWKENIHRINNNHCYSFSLHKIGSYFCLVTMKCRQPRQNLPEATRHFLKQRRKDLSVLPGCNCQPHTIL